MDMRGQVRSWNEDKGFGFIQPEAGGRAVFAHASSVVGGRRLTVGDRVLYRLGQDQQGRPCTRQVRLAGATVIDPPGAQQRPAKARARKARPSAGIQNLGLKLAILAGLLVLPLWGSLAVLAEYQSLLPLVTYIGVSVVSFLLYWRDKRSAQQARWRTPESSLHLAELGGGWPGALIAQQLLRHKTRKASFQLVCWTIVLLHQSFWVDFLFVHQLPQPYLTLLR